jgi:ketosteroid isomerase-like protein
MKDKITQENVRIVKDLFAAFERGDKQELLALSAEDIEWITPGEDWPLAGTRHGHPGLLDLVKKLTEMLETSFPEPPEFVAQGNRVLVIGFSTGKVNATNKTFEDHFIIAITVQNGKVKKVREYVDTQAMARASEIDANPKS